MPSSDKGMPHDQMHWLKTLIFTHLRFIKANNIKMIKGVHLLTPCPNMLISLIDQFRIFNGWMDGWTAGRTQARIQDFLSGEGGGGSRPDRQNTGSAHGTNTYVRMYTYIRMYRQAHDCSCTGRRMDKHVHV